MVFEVSKTWAEADGDTAEAIDFMEFYGREMLRWAGEQPVTPYPGEENSFEYIPLGVGAVIPPWNFPLAIMSGMTMAAVVTGNTVVLKPSSDSPTIAAKFIEIVKEVGLPTGVVNFISAAAAETGEAMVTHPKTRFISFTGSKGVGLHINEEAAKTRARPDLDQARRRRDGRQGCDRRRRRCRSRFGGDRRGRGCVRFPGTEMFGMFAPDRRRKGSRRADDKDRRADARS